MVGKAYNGERSSFFLKRTKKMCLWIKKNNPSSRHRRFGRAGLLTPTLSKHAEHLTQTYTKAHKWLEVKSVKVQFFSVAVRVVYLHVNLNHVLEWYDAACYGNAWEHLKWPEEQRGTASWGTTQASGIWLVKQRGLCSRASTVLSDTTCMHACTRIRVQQQHRHVADSQMYPKQCFVKHVQHVPFVLVVISTKLFGMFFSLLHERGCCNILLHSIKRTKFSWLATTKDTHT